MRKVQIEFPVISWGEAEIEVDDDMSDDEILEVLREGEVTFRIKSMGAESIVEDLRNFTLDQISDEIPIRLGIVQ